MQWSDCGNMLRMSTIHGAMLQMDPIFHVQSTVTLQSSLYQVSKLNYGGFLSPTVKPTVNCKASDLASCFGNIPHPRRVDYEPTLPTNC